MKIVRNVSVNNLSIKKIKLRTKTSLYTDVLAGDPRDMELIRPARLTEVWVALPHSQVTRTLFRIALSLASASRKTILALTAALTKLLAEILSLYARTGVVARPSRMIAGREVVDVIGTCKSSNK